MLLTKNDVRVEWFSGTGSGGQHRNKTQNCCRVIHPPTGLIESRQGRSRESNIREALTALTIRVQQDGMDSQVRKLNNIRSGQKGKGLRGEKIRTYRFHDDCVKNHLNKKKIKF